MTNGWREIPDGHKRPQLWSRHMVNLPLASVEIFLPFLSGSQQDTGVFVYSTIKGARYLIVSSFIIIFQFKGNELN